MAEKPGTLHVPEKQKERIVDSLEAIRFEEAEYKRNIYQAIIPVGVLPADLIEPKFWAHISAKLKPYNRIEVIADDGTFYGELLVLACGRAWAKVHVLRMEKLTTPDVSLTEAELSKYEVKFRGEHAKWSVVRKSDSHVVYEGAQTQGQAVDHLNELIRAGGG